MKILDIYDKLFSRYGKQYWWPGDSPWEIAVGAVLTQNTSWKNVELAISNLKQLKMLSPKKILNSNESLIQKAIRSSGYYKLKTIRLKNLSDWWLTNVRNDKLIQKAEDLDYWRHSLLSVNGVGRETADSILLYSFNLPTFVIDAYTKRVMARHFGTDPQIGYEELRKLFMDSLPKDPQLFNEFHALFVRVAKEECLKKECRENCPLR